MVLKVQVGLKYLHLKFVYKEEKKHAVKSVGILAWCAPKQMAHMNVPEGVVASRLWRLKAFSLSAGP
jgi:hypothetical protein